MLMRDETKCLPEHNADSTLAYMQVLCKTYVEI